MESRSSPILLSDITTPFSTLLCSRNVSDLWIHLVNTHNCAIKDSIERNRCYAFGHQLLLQCQIIGSFQILILIYFENLIADFFFVIFVLVKGEFTTLILMRAFFTSSLSVKAYNFESHELVFPKLVIAITFSFYIRLILIIVFGYARRTSSPIRRAKGGWTSSVFITFCL